MPIRYLFLFVGLVTLTAVGQTTTENLSAFEPPLNAPCRLGQGVDSDLPQCLYAKPSTKPAPDPPLCLMKKGDYYVACPKPKKHKAPVKPAWDMPTGAIDDGFAHWQAPKRPTVPEAITCEGCGSGDNLPLTVNKESCTTIYKGKWSDDTKTCYLVEQLGAVGAMMEQIAPEKAAVREWKSDSCWMPNTTTDACKLDPMSCLEWLEHCPAGGVPGPGMGDLVQPPADHKGWTGLPDPLKTAQDGYDCTMSRTPKTITISCTLKEPK